MTAVLPISAEPAAIPREDARPGRWRRMPAKAKVGAILLGLFVLGGFRRPVASTAALVGVAAIASECRGDISTKCAGVEPGGGRIEACLQSNFIKLSPPCVDVMARTVGRGG